MFSGTVRSANSGKSYCAIWRLLHWEGRWDSLQPSFVKRQFCKQRSATSSLTRLQPLWLTYFPSMAIATMVFSTWSAIPFQDDWVALVLSFFLKKLHFIFGRMPRLETWSLDQVSFSCLAFYVCGLFPCFLKKAEAFQFFRCVSTILLFHEIMKCVSHFTLSCIHNPNQVFDRWHFLSSRVGWEGPTFVRKKILSKWGFDG